MDDIVVSVNEGIH